MSILLDCNLKFCFILKDFEMEIILSYEIISVIWLLLLFLKKWWYLEKFSLLKEPLIPIFILMEKREKDNFGDDYVELVV